MSQTISDAFVEHLVQAGVQRIYGIVGDSLNPVIDAAYLKNPNFAKVAEAVGLLGIRIEDPADVRPGLQQMLAHPGPVVVDVIVDPNALSLPPHITFEQAKGYALSMTRLMLTGRADEVVEIMSSNIKDIGDIL